VCRDFPLEVGYYGGRQDNLWAVVSFCLLF
jgi:hypothetical protein